MDAVIETHDGRSKNIYNSELTMIENQKSSTAIRSGRIHREHDLPFIERVDLVNFKSNVY